MIYFDNAATGGYKPPEVTETVINTVKYLSANPGRSGHRLAVTGAKTVFATRTAFADTFGCPPERVIFTKNCTEALNTAIFGICRKGNHVITTVYEHNSVLRPLYALKNAGIITFDAVSAKSCEDLADAVEEKLRPETALIICTAVSNVTGEVMPIRRIGQIAEKHGILFLVDGAQGGGHIDLNMKDNKIDVLALAGHKGIYGIMGSGVLMFKENVDIAPFCYGGTGTTTFEEGQPAFYPERLEAGTLNLPAIAALGEGLRYAFDNFYGFSRILLRYTEKLTDGLKRYGRVKCYSSPNPAGIVSFSADGYDSESLSDLLGNEYDIAVRGGFHCAPLCHKFLGTAENGLVRVSVCPHNSEREINYFLTAIGKILRG